MRNTQRVRNESVTHGPAALIRETPHTLQRPRCVSLTRTYRQRLLIWVCVYQPQHGGGGGGWKATDLRTNVDLVSSFNHKHKLIEQLLVCCPQSEGLCSCVFNNCSKPRQKRSITANVSLVRDFSTFFFFFLLAPDFSRTSQLLYATCFKKGFSGQ